MAEKSLLASVLVAVSQALKNHPLNDAEAIQDIDTELRQVLSGVLESPMLVIADCRSACAEIHSLLTDCPLEINGDISDLTEGEPLEEPKNLEIVSQLQELAEGLEEIAQEELQDQMYGQLEIACGKVYAKIQTAKALIDVQVSKKAKRFDRLTEDQQAFIYGQIDDLRYLIEQLVGYADDNDLSLNSEIAEFDEELSEIYDEFQNQDDSDYDHSEGKSLVDLRELLTNLEETSFTTDR